MVVMTFSHGATRSATMRFVPIENPLLPGDVAHVMTHVQHAPWVRPQSRRMRQYLEDEVAMTGAITRAPDQSFIVFDYGKVKGGLGRLCIAFRDGDRWGRPIDLGDTVNRDLPWGAHLAPDGHTVYVTGQSGIWRLSLQPWLQRHALTDKAADGAHHRT